MKKQDLKQRPTTQKIPPLSFEEALKKILHTPKEQVEKAIKEAKDDKGPKEY